jgi:chromobox protein 1
MCCRSINSSLSNILIGRGTADLILDKYLESKNTTIAEIMAKENGEKPQKKGRKRGRASTVTETPKNGKRSRRSPHPAETSPPASLSEKKFTPPTGSWEDAVQNIDACEDHEGNIFVFLTWEGGHKTQHPLEQVYKRCPYKVRSLELIKVFSY